MPDADAYTMTPTRTRRNPGVAAVLSLVVPGVGQIYNGDFLRGIFWLIVTPGMWLGTGGLLGWICHVVAAFTAHNRANAKNMDLA
jgi:TM2 domain-containing membrane protein YozV